MSEKIKANIRNKFLYSFLALECFCFVKFRQEMQNIHYKQQNTLFTDINFKCNTILHQMHLKYIQYAFSLITSQNDADLENLLVIVNSNQSQSRKSGQFSHLLIDKNLFIYINHYLECIDLRTQFIGSVLVENMRFEQPSSKFCNKDRILVGIFNRST
jgi:hypothetical protein